MMSEKRFVCIDVGYGDDWYITDNGKKLSEMEIVDLLNEQQATIEQLSQSQDVKEFSALFNQSIALQREIKDLKEENEELRQQLKEKEEDEKLYANEILELRKTNEEWLQFKDLGGDY